MGSIQEKLVFSWGRERYKDLHYLFVCFHCSIKSKELSERWCGQALQGRKTVGEPSFLNEWWQTKDLHSRPVGCHSPRNIGEKLQQEPSIFNTGQETGADIAILSIVHEKNLLVWWMPCVVSEVRQTGRGQVCKVGRKHGEELLELAGKKGSVKEEPYLSKVSKT